MAEPIDWNLTTFDGVRLQQMREFAALTFLEKLQWLESMSEFVDQFRGSAAPRPIEPPKSDASNSSEAR